MKSLPALRLLSLAGLGTLMAVSSLAQTSTDPYFYGGIGVGKTRAKTDSNASAAAITGPGLVHTNTIDDATDAGYKLFGGYQMTPNLGVEAGFFNLGKTRFSSTTVPAGTLDGDSRYHGMNLDLVGTLPLGDRWSVLGRVGIHRTEAKGEYTGTGAAAGFTQGRTTTDTNYKVGVGMQYAITPSVLLRGEAERYRISDAVGVHGNINMLSVSLVFPFGRTAAPVRTAMAPPPAPMPMHVAPPPAPAPEPVVVMVPAQPVVVVMPAPTPPPVVAAPTPRRVSFSTDSLFGFDQAGVRPEGKTALDSFAHQIQGTNFDTITVEGHTDRLGTSAYNQKLSLQRAESVKTYLVNSGGLNANKIAAVGKGETAPVTKHGDCQGHKATAQLIACLQPDRRVEVEVFGTR